MKFTTHAYTSIPIYMRDMALVACTQWVKSGKNSTFFSWNHFHEIFSWNWFHRKKIIITQYKWDRGNKIAIA